ncbi:sensor histidine kinase, partial [Alicyclobacillus acidiphilus]
KWGYYYDGSTDYMIDPFFVSTSITDYQKDVGINTFIKRLQASNPDILAIAVLNSSFGQKKLESYSYKGTTWVDVSNRPVMYGTYAYRNQSLDVAAKNKACSTKHVVSVQDVIDGKRVLKTFIPDSLNGSKYVVEVVTGNRVINETLHHLWHNALIVSVLLILVVLGLSFAGSEFLARPLRRITATVDQIGSRNFDVRVSVRRSDEIGVLADHVNEMSANLLRYLQQVSVEERGKGVNFLVMATHALVHELGNPLVSIKYLTEFLPRVQSDLNEKAQEIVHRMKSSSEYANRIAREFSDFLKNGRIDLRRRDVIDIVQEAISLCMPMAQSRAVTLDFVNRTGERRIVVEADRDKLLAALVNVVKNAIDAIADDVAERHVLIDLTKQEADLQIDVIDSGTGIPKEQWESIFMPYRSTKKNGLGLGLTFTGFIVLAHGGVVEVADSSDRGTTMRIRLHMQQ